MNSTLNDELRDIANALVADAPAVPTYRAHTASAASALPKWLPLTAAAAVAVSGIAGVVATTGRDGTGEHRAPSDAIESGVPGDGLVAMPALYPVVNDLPDEGFAEVAPHDQLRLGGNGPQAVAIVGESGADDVFTSTLTITAGLELTYYGEPTGTTSAFGVAASVHDESEVGGPAGRRTVVWGTPPAFNSDAGLPFLAVIGQPASAGADPIEFLAEADPSFASFSASATDGPVDLTIGELPEGYEVIAGPESLDLPPWTAYLRLNDHGPFVQTTSSNPLYGYVGLLEPTTVNGISAWIADADPRVGGRVADGGSAVVWKVGESTWARASVAPGDDPVELAESVDFVDWDTWNGMYDATSGYPDPDFVPITGPFEYPESSELILDCSSSCPTMSSEQQQALEDYIASLPGGTVADSSSAGDL